jgi:ankyrin repeat protein
MQIAGGRLNVHAHDDDEIRRELTLRSLGGDMHGCATVVHAWRNGDARLPRVIRRQRAAFFRHAGYGHTDDVIGALDAGFDVSARAGDRSTLLHFLARLDHERLWPRLRDAGLPIDARNHHGRTPLHAAAILGHIEVVELLLAHGADPKAKDGEGHTPDQYVDERNWHPSRRTEPVPVVQLLRERRRR